MTEDTLRHMTTMRAHERIRDAELERLARQTRGTRDPKPERALGTALIAFLVLTRREVPQ
jgi:hypothetical protein